MDSSSSATSRVPPALVGSAVMRIAHRQRDAESGATGRGRLVEDTAAVLRENALAQREAEAAPTRFGREEGCEQTRPIGLGHPGSIVGHRHGEDFPVSIGTTDAIAGIH